MANPIKFSRGTTAFYETINSDVKQNLVFFNTSTQKLVMGGNEYGLTTAQETALMGSIKGVSFTKDSGKLVFSFNDAGKANLEINLLNVLPIASAGIEDAEGNYSGGVAGLMSPEMVIKLNSTANSSAIADLKDRMDSVELINTNQATAIDNNTKAAKAAQDAADQAQGEVDALEKIVGEGFSEESTVADQLDAVRTVAEDAAKNSDLTAHTGNTEIHITADERTAWDEAVDKKHEHENKTVLDGITAEKVTAWDASEQNAKNYADAEIQKLDYTDSLVEGQFITAVDQADGKISVQRAAVNAEKISFGTDSNVKAALEAHGAAIEVLNGTAEVDGSVAKAVADAKTEIIGGASADYNTLKKIEDKLSDAISEARTYSVVALTGDEINVLPDGTNVKEAYKLVADGDETKAAVGEVIKVYKDSSLKEVELVDQNLQFTYILANGTESTVSVDVSTFLAETEFENGLQVDNESGKVSVLVDPSSEFLSVGAAGVKVSGVQNAIDNANKLSADYVEQTYAEVSGITWKKVEKTNTHEDAIEKLDENIKVLIDEVIENELTHAGNYNSLNDRVTANEGNIATNTQAIAVLNGDAEGSVAKAVADGVAEAKGYTDDEILALSAEGGAIHTLAGRVSTNETNISNLSGLVGEKSSEDTDTVFGAINANAINIATLMGTEETEGSVAKAEADARDYADSLWVWYEEGDPIE